MTVTDPTATGKPPAEQGDEILRPGVYKPIYFTAKRRFQ
jgi:hypothetical protein